jgi:hypothetical protein
MSPMSKSAFIVVGAPSIFGKILAKFCLMLQIIGLGGE